MESGIIYGTLIDPILLPMRKRLTNEINADEKVIDIASGTGAQAFEIASKSVKVVGIDHSPSMIRFAEKRKNKLGLKNINFVQGDATSLVGVNDKSFDIATMSLALHQFNPEQYQPILAEMKRVANRIIIIDYAVPLPSGHIGLGARTAEFLAGREHNRNFKKYYRKGGLKTILPEKNIIIEKSVLFGGGGFELVCCSYSE